ncbi:MAG: efflux RND transporter periplasmic adaptor subunit [Kiritimatiellia bacterium]
MRALTAILALAPLVAAWADSIRLPVVEVVERPFREVRTCPGRVVAIARVNVVPQVSGEILEVGFKNGEVVPKGALLYRLDPVKYEAAVKNAEAKLAECRANVKYADSSYERHKKLLGTHAVSLDAVDNALSQRDSARAALAAAQAELVAAQDDLEHCTIVAPIGGKLGSTALTEGNYVVKGSEPLVTLVQPAPIRIRFSIPNGDYLRMFGAQAQRIREESEVAITLANGETLSEPGVIEYVDNEADEMTDTIQVFAVYPNEGRRLKPGGTVAVSFAVRKGVPRPAIPPTAILQDVQGPYVWVVGPNGAVERRSVARGSVVDDWLFIEKGLSAGERVVADGAQKVRRGMTVEAVP